MKMNELIDNILSVDEEISVRFKPLDKTWVLIFSRSTAPIAHVFTEADEYSIDYPTLYKLDLYSVLQIDAWLYEYSVTPVREREIPF